MKSYPLAEDLVRPVRRVAMPRAPRPVAPGSTMHVVARWNNREFYVTSAEDCERLLAHLRELVRTYEVTLYAYMLVSNHVHFLVQASKVEALGTPNALVTFHPSYRALSPYPKVRQRQYRALLAPRPDQ